MEAAVASGILKIVGSKLAPLLIKEYSLIVGVQKHLEELNDQVQEINCWLEAVGDEVARNGPALNWLRKLKDIAYDVDDIVDEFQLEAESHDAHGVGGVVSNYLCAKPKSLILRCKAASKLKAVKKRFDGIVKQRTEFSTIANSLLASDPVRDMNHNTANMTSLPIVDVASVLGRDQEKNQIISKLVETSDQQRIKTISIIGLGGSGKTTLAKLVFNDCSIIEKHFEVRLWVHVSQEFDVEKLVKKLFEAFADNNPGQHALPYMSKTISDKLTGKRFLLVLDDVWTESQILWEQFMVYLKGGAHGSRILLTSRSRKVAEVEGSAYQFDLPFLSLNDSWELFQQSLVMPPGGLEVEFVDVGKDIVKKCGGVPLAIKALAGALRGKELIEEWQAMRDSNLLHFVGEERGVSVSACLRLSYFQLSSHLKQCFTICSLFPKGHKIDKEQLIDLWIAHDMLTLESGVDYLDYIGHKCFNSLVKMSFLQDVNEYRERVTCGMHDLVHDLARSILDDEISLDVPKDETCCTKSYRYFSLTGQAQNVPPKNMFQKARSIYVDNCADAIFGALKDTRHLRSITVGTMYMQAIPIAILQVKNLKYLVISRLRCEALPEAISDIWSLQALHVTFSAIVELPKSIGKLKKLRKLNLFWCWKLKCLPDSIGDCQMISSIDLCKCENLTVLPESIGRMEKLRVLRLGETKIERLPSGITALRNLERLYLDRCRELVELPEGIGNLEKLQVLDLEGSVNLRGMPIGIGQLSRLQKLDLFVVGEGEKFAAISELGNVGRNSEDLRIRGIDHVTEPDDDAHKACLKQKANLQWLELRWRMRVGHEENPKLEQAVLDGLEPPPGIKGLEIVGYSGRECARWMQDQVGGGVQRLSYFPYLRVMHLHNFPNLKHLDGLAELPCLEELELKYLASLESISGGPFPSLVKLVMRDLPSLGEVWMVAEKSMPDGCSNCTPHLGQVLQVGSCVSNLDIWGCPMLEVKPYLPLSLQHLVLYQSNGQLLQSPCACSGSPSFSGFSHLKKLELQNITGCGRGWELLQHMTALESLRILDSDELTELPECFRSLKSLRELTIMKCKRLSSLPQSMGHLTSLQVLRIEFCDAFHELPERLGELRSLRRLGIEGLPGLSCLPQSMRRLTSLEVLKIRDCPGIKSLREWIKGLTALRELWIWGCPDLARRCERGKGEDWHLVSHIPELHIW
ncbi:hypothetical protein C2845_PM17G00680 [Panicum miliaceum]|uniref:Disease resistance protein RGA3 n=1 Tax=Panicum miliaceum TaxID=4540 RepID=A0A3L6Q422_PANMI|nr:hypothetical protein C2845_PM17G00680 [Panicum miliaceum]